MLYYFYNELLNKYMYEVMDLFRQGENIQRLNATVAKRIKLGKKSISLQIKGIYIIWSVVWKIVRSVVFTYPVNNFVCLTLFRNVRNLISRRSLAYVRWKVNM